MDRMGVLSLSPGGAFQRGHTPGGGIRALGITPPRLSVSEGPRRWAPWGYYLDILLALAVGTGILLLVLDDLGVGWGRYPPSRETFSGPGGNRTCSMPCWRVRSPFPLSAAAPCTSVDPEGGRFVRGAGVCAGWPEGPSRRPALQSSGG